MESRINNCNKLVFKKERNGIYNQSIKNITLSIVFSFKPSPKFAYLSSWFLHLQSPEVETSESFVYPTTSNSRFWISLGLHSHFCFYCHCPMSCHLYLGYCNSPQCIHCHHLLSLCPKSSFTSLTVTFLRYSHNHGTPC